MPLLLLTLNDGLKFNIALTHVKVVKDLIPINYCRFPHFRGQIFRFLVVEDMAVVESLELPMVHIVCQQ